MTLKNNRVPLLSNIKLCASFHFQIWIQTGVTVWKWLNGVMTSVTLTFDLWPWPLAWTLCLSIAITPGNFRMIQWQEHCQKGVTDGQTDRQTEISVLRAAWSQLKILLLGTKLCQSDHYKIWCHDIRLVAALSLHAKYSLVIRVTFNSLPPVAPLTKEGNLWLAKHPLVYNGHLAKHRLTSFVKEAKGDNIKYHRTWLTLAPNKGQNLNQWQPVIN